ncbi:cyanophycinase [Rossellomorea aquimaris]|uniref:cyanophycinase n=1 Tax=Rossellomorea aquimaris TaxID=189382 RepID=UPI001CFEAD1E|nr:cyanophycinase [Rossellomorea aquimaris]
MKDYWGKVKKLFIVLTVLGLIASLATTDILAKKEKNIKGNLLIVGGALGSSNSDVYEKFIQLSGGKKKAKIGIIPSASGSLKSSNQFKEDLISYGVEEKSIEIFPISSHDFLGTEEDESLWKNNAENKQISKQIKKLTGIWFVGGDQLKITDALLRENGEKTMALEEVWGIYEKGAVIGGTSAGAAIMSDVMITGGDSLGGLRQEFTTEDVSNPNEEYAPVYIEKGLGFFQWGIVDQHFNERSRLGRLAATALRFKAPDELAYGIDEDTAMVVNNQEGTVSVLGRSHVTIVDVASAKTSGNEIRDLDISFLSPGDELKVKTKEYMIEEDKVETKDYEYYNFKPLQATGVLSSYGTLPHYLSYSLVDNEAVTEVTSYLYDSQGKGFELTFKQGDDTNGFWGYQDGQKDSYSLLHVEMDVSPVKVSFNEKDRLEDFKETPLDISESAFDPDTKGSLVIVGGALGISNEEVYKEFIERAGETGKIGIIPAASSSLKSSQAFKEDLTSYGVPSEQIDILPISNHDFKGTEEDESEWTDNKNHPDIAGRILDYDAIWFVGGDQTDITDALLNRDGTKSLALENIWEIYRDGAVLGGTSAGAAIMSDVMIAGGGSNDTLAKGFTDSYDGMSQQEGGPGYLEKGLGFFPYGIVDQHFDKKARLGRLIATTAVYGEENELSYGIDEDTALIVDNQSRTVEVKGRGGVSIVDLSHSDFSPSSHTYEDIRLSWITSGDQFNLETKEFSISDHKLSTNDYEFYNYYAAPHTGVLTPHPTLANYLSYSLLDNARKDEVKSYSFSENEGFELTFRKGSGTEGFWGYKDGYKDDYSFLGVDLDIKPVEVMIENN